MDTETPWLQNYQAVKDGRPPQHTWMFGVRVCVCVWEGVDSVPFFIVPLCCLHLDGFIGAYPRMNTGFLLRLLFSFYIYSYIYIVCIKVVCILFLQACNCFDRYAY